MTEGPEATYLRSYVARHFKGRRLRSILIRGGRYSRHGLPTGLATFRRHLPARLEAVEKKGKVILFRFEGGWTLIAKMGMTGWFSRPVDAQLFESQPSVIFRFDGPVGDLYWSDFRNFGTLTFTRDPAVVEAAVGELAPDILDVWDGKAGRDVCRRLSQISERREGKMTVAEALMDQKLLVSGVGNIIKSEALYDAGLSPRRTLRSLKERECQRLVSSTRKIARKVLRYLEGQGQSFDRGAYMGLHSVYGRTRNARGRSVRRYTAKDGRSTFWVPAVQH